MTASTENAVGVAEMKAQLGCSRDTVYRMVHDGSIPAFRVRREWRFYPSKVREALESPVDLWAPPSRKKKRNGA